MAKRKVGTATVAKRLTRMGTEMLKTAKSLVSKEPAKKRRSKKTK